MPAFAWWPYVVVVILLILAVGGLITSYRQRTILPGVEFRGSPLYWAVVVFLLLLLLPNLYHSSVTSVLADGTYVTCDGNTGIDMNPTGQSECAPWGEELLAGGLDLPAGIAPEDVTRLDIERAFFGFIDRCTARVSTTALAADPVYGPEIVIPCR